LPPHHNVLGEDPLLIDPENGNFRVQPGSAAAEYGCQIFADGRILAEQAKDRERQKSIRRDQIEVSGVITEDTHWNAEQVLVTGDILVQESATLSIEPGTEIIFTGYYGLEVHGGLWAEGSAEERIIFTAADSELFTADDLPLGCWQGIYFAQSATALPSKIEYSIIQYAKAISANQADFDQSAGGAVRIYNRQNIVIANSVFRHNLAYRGGAIYCHKMANPTLFGNLIYHNYALINAAAVYLTYSYPQLYNNTIVDNFIYNQDPYIETCAIKNYLSKPQFYNNIIRNNLADLPYLHQQIWQGKEYLSYNNNLEDNGWDNGNIDANPGFMIEEEWGYQISQSSASTDSGSLQLAYLADHDLLGNERVWGRTIDQGCFEAISTSAEGDLELWDYQLFHYPNPLYLQQNLRNLSVTISYQLPQTLSQAKLAIFNLKGQRIRELSISANPGENLAVWDGKDWRGQFVASGIYYYQLLDGRQALQTGKISLIK
jgi:predicted outer membrane repeat protein